MEIKHCELRIVFLNILVRKDIILSSYKGKKKSKKTIQTSVLNNRSFRHQCSTRSGSVIPYQSTYNTPYQAARSFMRYVRIPKAANACSLEIFHTLQQVP